jgi:hypothetical protein
MSERELHTTTHKHVAMTATKTLYVSNFNDNGSLRNPLPGSLREAIKNGHEFAKDGYAIKILFETDKNSEQINLQNTLHLKWGTWSINEGENAKDITLNGDNKTSWAININHYIHRAPDQPTNVSINQINVTNFYNTDTGWYEGTIKNYNGSLTWRNSIFKNNTSTSGVVNSKSSKSDINLENIQFKDNTMLGGAKDSEGITDENELIVIRDENAKIEATNINLKPNTNLIEAQSKIHKEGEFSLEGKYKLNPNKGYVIYQAIENGEKNMVTPSSSNDEQLLGAIRQHASYTYRTKSEQEIKDSRTSFFGSELSKTMGKTVASQAASAAMGSKAAMALKAKATAKVTAMAATTAGKAALGATGVLGAAAAIGIGALFHDSQETARIEAELAEKRVIDAEHDAFKAALPKRLEFNPINTLQTRRVNIYKGFDFTHRDSAYFLPAGMDTDISYINQTDGQDVVRFSYIPKSLKESAVATNSAKEYARWVLSEELTQAMRNEAGKDPVGYISSLKKVNNKGEIFLTNTGRWQTQLTNNSGYYAGPADDRIKIERRSSFGVSTMTQTHSGDDVVIGDRGDNIILLDHGNDTATPDIGVDHIDGGAGIDTVSYLGLNQPIQLSAGHHTRSGEHHLQVNNRLPLPELHSLNSRLFNVESIDAEGGSYLDFSDAKPANRGLNNSDSTVSNYRIRTGSSSTVVGSDHDDGIIIDAGRQSLHNSNISRLSETSFIEGGAGKDSLLIKNLADHQQAGRQFKIDMLTGSITSTDATNQPNQSTQRIWFSSHSVEVIGLQGASISENGLIKFDKETNEITSFRPLQPDTEFQINTPEMLNPTLDSLNPNIDSLI